MAKIKNMHYTICLKVISSSVQVALPPAFARLEQRGVRWVHCTCTMCTLGRNVPQCHTLKVHLKDTGVHDCLMYTLCTVKCPVLWKCTTSINQASQEQNWSAIRLTTLKNISLNGPSKILRPHICLSMPSTSPSLESRKLIFSLTELICWGLTPAFPPEKDVRLILQPYLLFSPSQPTRSRRPMPDSIKTLKQFYTSSLMARFVVFVSSSFMTSLLLLLSTFKRLPERGLDWCSPRQRVAEKWSWRPVLWPPRLHATTFARMGQK